MPAMLRRAALVTVPSLLLGLAIGTAPARLAAQQPRTVAIDPGMTRDQVVTRLGTPDTESHFGGFTYLFYENGCIVKCGIDDVVVLDKDIVTDAIFRSPKRVFTGVSSSPQGLPPIPASHFMPEPIRASTSDDSAHRGGIVFAEPRAPMQPPRYTRIIPTHADSARMGVGNRPVAPTGPDSAAPPTR
jgi:hypothetical protein